MKASTKKGFTLIETLVTVIIFSLVMAVTVGFIAILYRTHSYTWQQSLAINEARRGIDIMVKEIREARTGDDGSYPIEIAQDKEFVFFSDIDEDGETERVRYFLGTVNSGVLAEECVTFSDGGSCSVSFNNFFTGNLVSAELEISVEGDFGWDNLEYAEVYVDGQLMETVCEQGCNDCAGDWQGNIVFDVTDKAVDNNIQILTDSNWRVNDFCDWQDPNHAMKVRAELRWTESLTQGETDFKKGVISPTGSPPQYLSSQEEITILSSYVRNSPPIFKYYDAEGSLIQSYPSRLIDTKMIKVFLVIDVNEERSPFSYELESAAQLRNLKDNNE